MGDLFVRAQARVQSLAARAVEVLVVETPVYAVLPPEQMRGEIRRLAERHLEVMLRCMAERRAPRPEELSAHRAAAARRAEEHVPLESLQMAHHLIARTGWLGLLELAGPDEQAELLAAVESMSGYLTAVTGAVATAWQEERANDDAERLAARRALARALVDGAPVEAPLLRAGTSLSPRYVVLAVRLGEAHADPDETMLVAERRRARRVLAGVDLIAPGEVLSLLEPDGGLLLLPCPAGDDPVTPRLAALSDDLVAHLDVVLIGASEPAGVTALADAAEQAQEVLGLARQLGRPSGLYRLQDVVLEYQLTRPGPGLPAMAALLEPLAEHPDLLHTLRTFVELDRDRRRCATALHIHPNTLDYRVRRAVELLGLDPARSQGLQLIGAALAAQRILHPEAQPPVAASAAPVRGRPRVPAPSRPGSGAAP